MSYSQETKDAARKLFLRRFRVPEIQTELGVPRRTLYQWAASYGWLDQLQDEEATSAITRRLVLLADRDKKTGAELEEMDKLVGMLERLQRLESRKQTTKAADVTPPTEQDQGGASKPKKKRKGRRNNDFSGYDAETILDHFKAGLFDYQLNLWDERHHRIRNVLKSRQLGLTFYFAREAFTDALLTGDNQVFLSASRAQADLFREYIAHFASEWFGIELKGKDKIKIHSDAGSATLYFLSTNSATAQGYHGHVYVDEYFWIPNFDKLNKVASAVATHKNWRKTYFSTPSAMSHSAYPFWSMETFNKRQRAANEPDYNLPSRTELKGGVVCADGQWRQIITVHDAVKGGCDLFDIKQLRIEYNLDEFSQLFECKFIDDTASVFKLSDLEKCLGDLQDWRDFKPDSDRPLGNRPVWIGYDPSRTRDGACIVVVAPPLKAGGKFRIVERIALHNCAWQYQAQTIKDLCERYRVEYIGVDVTGPGSGVFEQVQRFFPAATAITYSPQMKTRLVLKAQQVVLEGRVEWDASWSDIAAGFMQIRKTTTGSGQIVYVADRNDKTGHADAAWAVTHALINEGLLTPDDTRRSKVVFADAA
ncbi:terminase ATPase subunit family protein [Marinobacter nanhaiticus D15-8W]|uniref:Terminase n=1 Tax=Marinobacter nanhaiticus D15-8W TaxID=626887 RepID=N6X0L8_9GAMM|nr:terminase family protein [Marinobacter nanhaiticus]ENO14598.1 terminase [Marinobacter nanhaiticus D15-8W]BES69717.1 terminase ATPase subunit family protein [Marinobacter nanhaiticus D15-8W]BES69762.1 terminase ATPase subunit family protein [Marinobacter nanhaiticus D15-8W]